MTGDLLNHFYDDLKPMNPNSRHWEENGVLKKFDQQEFISDELKWYQSSGLDKHGYVYYPNECIDGQLEGDDKCKVHMFLHGCASGYENLGDYVIRNSGWT